MYMIKNALQENHPQRSPYKGPLKALVNSNDIDKEKNEEEFKFYHISGNI